MAQSGAIGEADPVLPLIATEAAAFDHLEGLSGVEGCTETAAWQAADMAHFAALAAVCECVPTTPAGLVAALDVYQRRSRDFLPSPFLEDLASLFASVRTYVEARS